MHVVILGCGRVGSLLAGRLDAMGHSVSVVDQDSKAFTRLPQGFRGSTVTGVGFDRETLELAGITHAEAFAAVSSGDNSNILAARVARETYGVDRVVARIYDPQRAEVYQRLGIPTVATVSWTSGQILRRILPLGSETEYTDPSGTVSLAEVHLGDAWLGHRVTALERQSGARVAFITRLGAGLLPHADSVIQQGDLVHMVFAPGDREHMEAVLEKGPES